jgi:hypothetical protein
MPALPHDPASTQMVPSGRGIAASKPPTLGRQVTDKCIEIPICHRFRKGRFGAAHRLPCVSDGGFSRRAAGCTRTHHRERTHQQCKTAIEHLTAAIAVPTPVRGVYRAVHSPRADFVCTAMRLPPCRPNEDDLHRSITHSMFHFRQVTRISNQCTQPIADLKGQSSSAVERISRRCGMIARRGLE